MFYTPTQCSIQVSKGLLGFGAGPGGAVLLILTVGAGCGPQPSGESEADSLCPLSEGSWAGWQQQADSSLRSPLPLFHVTLSHTDPVTGPPHPIPPALEPFSNVPKQEPHLAGAAPIPEGEGNLGSTDLVTFTPGKGHNPQARRT